MSSFPSNVEMKKASTNWLPWVLVPIFIISGIGLRYAGLKFLSLDMHYFLLGWYDQLAKIGFGALREHFSNYTPPYLYLLFVATKTAGFIPKIAAIKLIPICFDFLNAFLVYKILKIRFPQGATALIGASAFLLLPTVLVNSAYWGQSDSIYTFFLVACLLFLMREQPLPAMIFLGISFSFKAQAAFIAPLIFLLILKKKIPWFYLGIVPAVYVLMMIPAALTGRPFIELLKIYLGQEETYSALSMHAPNWYLFFPKSLQNQASVLLGLMVTIIAVLAWTTVYENRFKEFTPPVILLCAMMSVALTPFFLPKMHERYFYLADVISFLMAFYFPSGWLLALGYQLTSGLTYSIYLIASVMRIKHPLVVNLLFPALLVNIALLGFMFSNRWKLAENSAETTT
jgi:Gpi18-like mannosyltransferase